MKRILSIAALGTLIASSTAHAATNYGFKNTVANTKYIVDVIARGNPVYTAVSVGPMIGKVQERSEADAFAKGNFDIVGFEIRDENRHLKGKVEWINRDLNTRNFKIVEGSDNRPTIVEWKD